jgi:hypothetical protein
MTEYEKYIAAQETEKWLASLTVSKCIDEHGDVYYNVTDYNGDWIGDAFETAELAFDEIDKLRKDTP